MSINNDLAYQRVNYEPNEWSNLIKPRGFSATEKIKMFVSSIFGVKSEWVEKNIPFEGAVLFNREFLEILEDFNLTPKVEDNFHRLVPVGSVLHEIYENILKLDNSKQMEQGISFLKKLYLDINPNIVKPEHISKAIRLKNDHLLELIYMINPSLYLTFLLGRYPNLNNPDSVYYLDNFEKLHIIAERNVSPIIEEKAEIFLSTQQEGTVEEFLANKAEVFFKPDSSSILEETYEKIIKSDNPKQIEEDIALLKKLYLDINPNVVKSNHITKALAQKNDPLIELIYMINPTIYLTFLLGRYRQQNNLEFISPKDSCEKLHSIAMNNLSPIIEVKAETFLTTQREDTVIEFLSNL